VLGHLSDAFEVETVPVGEGRSARVFAATKHNTGERVALKVNLS